MNLLDLTDDILGVIFDPKYAGLLACNVAMHVCKKLAILTRPHHLSREEMINEAARVGCIPLLKWGGVRMRNDHSVSVEKAAALHGQLNVLIWLRGQTNCWLRCAAEQAIIGGHIHILDWLYQKDHEYPFDMQTPVSAAIGGHVSMFEWLHEKDIQFHWAAPGNALHNAASKGFIGAVEWLMTNLRNHIQGYDITNAYDEATKWDHLPVVRYLYPSANDGCVEEAPGIALENHSPNVFEWHRDNVPKSTNVYVRAARNGLLDVVIVLHKNDYPMSENVAKLATANGYLTILKYLAENGCPLSSEVFQTAVQHNNIAILEYLLSIGCPYEYTHRLTTQALNRCQINEETVRWTHKNLDPRRYVPQHHPLMGVIHGYMRDDDRTNSALIACAYAAASGDLDIIKCIDITGVETRAYQLMIDCAAHHGNLNVLSWLRQLGVDISPAIDVARRSGAINVINWLEVD